MTAGYLESSTAAVRPLRILAIAPVSGYGGHNTSIHRISAFRALGHHVTVIDSTIFRFFV